MSRVLTRRGAARLMGRLSGGLFAGVLARPVSAASPPLRVVVPQLPSSLDPHRAVSACDRLIASEIYPGLMVRDAAGAPVAGLADSWTQTADRLIFTLRENLVWSDGTPLTAADVVFSFTRARDPATAAPFARLVEALEGPPVAVDRRTIHFAATRRSSRILDRLCEPVAAIVPRHAPDSLPAGRVVAGPWLVDVAAPALTLRTNPRWRGQGPASEALQLFAADSFDAAADAVVRGEADLTWGWSPAVPGERTTRLLRSDPMLHGNN